jgi:hypothetical protein
MIMPNRFQLATHDARITDVWQRCAPSLSNFCQMCGCDADSLSNLCGMRHGPSMDRLLGVWLLVCGLSCLPMTRDQGVPPGVMQGRVVSEQGRGVPYARVTIDRVHRVVIADVDGVFRIADLPAGSYTLRCERDENGDGLTDVGGLVDARLELLSDGRVGATLLGEVVLRAGLRATGVVVNGAGSQVVAVRLAGDGTRFSEDVVTADDTGSYTFPRLLSAASMEVVAVSADGRTVSALAAVVLPELRLQSVLSPLRLAISPAVVGARIEATSARGTQVFSDVTVGEAPIEIDVGDDAGPFDVLVQAGELEGYLSSIVPVEAAWSMVLSRPTCVLIGDRDCDGDGMLGLPFTQVEGVPQSDVWEACASTCYVFGAALDVTVCPFDDRVYDCDDDADGQPDVSEPALCQGRGDDFDGDGLCGASDPFPNCVEHDPAAVACGADAEPTSPPIRIEFGGGEGEGEEGEGEEGEGEGEGEGELATKEPTALIYASGVRASDRFVSTINGGAQRMIAGQQQEQLTTPTLQVDGRFTFAEAPLDGGPTAVVVRVPVTFDDNTDGFALFASDTATLMLAGVTEPPSPRQPANVFAVAPIDYPANAELAEVATLSVFSGVTLDLAQPQTLTITQSLFASPTSTIAVLDVDRVIEPAVLSFAGSFLDPVTVSAVIDGPCGMAFARVEAGSTLQCTTLSPPDVPNGEGGVTVANGGVVVATEAINVFINDGVTVPQGRVQLGTVGQTDVVTIRPELRAQTLVINTNVVLGAPLLVQLLEMNNGVTQDFISELRDLTTIPECCADAVDRTSGITCGSVVSGCESPSPILAGETAAPLFVDDIGFVSDEQIAAVIGVNFFNITVTNATEVPNGWRMDPNAATLSINVTIAGGGNATVIAPVVRFEPLRVVACVGGAPTTTTIMSRPAGALFNELVVVNQTQVDGAGVEIEVDCSNLPKVVPVTIGGNITVNGAINPVQLTMALLVVDDTFELPSVWTGRGDDPTDRRDSLNWTNGVPALGGTSFMVDVGQARPPPLQLNTGTVIVGDATGELPTSVDLSESVINQLVVGANSEATSVTFPITLSGIAPRLRGNVGQVLFESSMGNATIEGSSTTGTTTVAGGLVINGITGERWTVNGDLTVDAPITITNTDLVVTGSTRAESAIDITNSTVTLQGLVQTGPSGSWNLNSVAMTLVEGGDLGSITFDASTTLDGGGAVCSTTCPPPSF